MYLEKLSVPEVIVCVVAILAHASDESANNTHRKRFYILVYIIGLY